ncbi:MAG: hypothetical protein WCG27_03825 [Pseudomonadota bacterium]
MGLFGKKKEKEIIIDENLAYYQFFKSLNIPVYLQCEKAMATQEWSTFLKQHQFEELNKDELKKMLPSLNKTRHARVLKIVEATPTVAQQIDMIQEQDRYGEESITPRDMFKVYRYKGHGLIMYSALAREWNCGLVLDGKFEDKKLVLRSILNRYLSWALAPLGMVGFWGVPVDQGVVVLKQAESFGEAFFVDLANHRVLTVDGMGKIKSHFKMMRLDPMLKGRNIRMSNEELLSYLTIHCVYFDYPNLSVPIRQLIQEIAKTAEGLVHPRENFKPRTDLSL